MASAASPISIHREPVPIRLAILHGPVPVSGIVLHPWNPAGTVAGPLAVTVNATLIPVGTEHRVTNNPAPQNEVSVAMNPRNGRNLLASANDYRGYPGLPGDGWCGVYSTLDGGRTWLEQLVPRTGPLTQVTVSGDPSVAFDADGNGYVTCLGFSRTLNDNVLAVSKSTDGGRTWGTAALVEGTTPNVFHDKPYMAVDTTSAPTRNTVYVTWTRFISGPGECGNYAAPIYFSRSIDGGLTFSGPMEISSAGYRCSQGSQPAVGPGGEVYVSWVNGNGAVVVRSTDAGLTWGPKSTIAMLAPGEIYGGAPRTPHFPSIAVNPVNAPTGNRVHVVWTDRRFGTADILMSTSEDGAATWGPAVRVNDDLTNAQFFPWVAASETGKVFVSFYDQRDDVNARDLTVYVAASADFGASFQKNVRASASFDPGNWFIGDYNGLTASADFAYPVWCDLRNGGNEEVYIAGPPTLSPGLPRMMNP
jgi:hypothetical protein